MEYIKFLNRNIGEKVIRSQEDHNKYVPRLFEAANTNTLHQAILPMSDGGVCRTADGDVIRDHTIVEMTYKCKTSHTPECWHPLRIRRDKTERYQTTGSISGAANDIVTALGVWRSICFPITEDMLTGIVKIPEADLQAAVDAASGGMYYIRNRPREQSASLPMMVFHNQWVKKDCLINRFKGHALSLVDFGCGRGGDINKWDEAMFLRVLGIDPVDDNLTHPGPINEGACSRAMNARLRSHGRFPKIVFLRMDAAKVINAEYIETTDPETRAISKALWALDDITGMTPEMRNLHGFAAQGFDLASSMFVVHYFFDSITRLRDFATNVANQLRPGGHFFGTCLDGERVVSALASVAKGQSIEGRSKDGRLLWNVTKHFDDIVLEKKKKKEKLQDDPRIGRKIRVFVESIGQPIDEYLMDFALLKEVMAEKGLVPMPAVEATKLGFKGSDGYFEDLYREMTMSPSSKDNKHAQVAMQMSDAEKEYSFMHRWFVFTKRQ